MLYLRTFGGVALARDGVIVAEIASQYKQLALLTVLAALGERGVGRERLASYLWEESDGERARGGLNQALYALRKLLGEPDLVVGSREVRLNPSLISSDVTAFKDAVASGKLETAVGLYSGPFLDGFHVTGAEEFERWSTNERSRLARMYAEALNDLAEWSIARGAHESAVRWLRLHTDHEPLDARKARQYMDALAAAGDRASAIRHGLAFTERIRAELGAEPDDDVLAALNRLRRGATEVEPLDGHAFRTPR